MTVTPELLLNAYRAGVFPMSEGRDDPELFWVDPRKRGVFPLENFRISRSMARELRRDTFAVTINTDFAAVLDGCADREETWINGEIRALYQQLFHLGHAHSLEVWQDNQLAGGVYGVTLGAAFFGESMFSRRTNASKIALAWLVDHLRRCEFQLFDTQFLTPHLASLGAVEISRAVYRAALSDAMEFDADFTAQPLANSGYDVVQRNGQTS